MPAPSELVDLPRPWLDALTVDAEHREPSGSLSMFCDPGRVFTIEQAQQWCRDAVERVAAATGGGAGGTGRNNALNDAAVTVWHFLDVLPGLDQQTAERELFNAAVRSGLVADDGERSVRATIRSGLQGPATGRWRAIISDVPAPAVDVAPDVSAPPMSSLIVPAIDWHELWADETTEQPIVEPILYEGRQASLYAPTGIGKSLITQELAAGVSCGKAVLGGLPSRPYVVIYVDLENSRLGDIRPRLEAMGYGPGDLANLKYLSFPSLAALDSQLGGQQLIANVDHYGAEVVIIDTLSRTVNGDENSNDTWLQWYRHTGMQLKARRVGSLRLDHEGKDGSKGQRGGSAKLGDVDAVWKLSQVTPESVYRLECEKSRMPLAIEQRTVVLHRRSDPLRHDVDARGWRGAADAKQQQIIEALDAAGLPNDAGRDSAREVMQQAGISARNDVIGRAIDVRKLRMATDESASQ